MNLKSQHICMKCACAVHHWETHTRISRGLWGEMSPASKPEDRTLSINRFKLLLLSIHIKLPCFKGLIC